MTAVAVWSLQCRLSLTVCTTLSSVAATDPIPRNTDCPIGRTLSPFRVTLCWTVITIRRTTMISAQRPGEFVDFATEEYEGLNMNLGRNKKNVASRSHVHLANLSRNQAGHRADWCGNSVPMTLVRRKFSTQNLRIRYLSLMAPGRCLVKSWSAKYIWRSSR
jgi:hypothetical protein